jgi:hypothetical protein
VKTEQVAKTIYWHRELPPMDCEPLGAYTLEATSGRVPGTLSYRDMLWDRCHLELMDHARMRLEQEIVRMGADCAHVLSEEIAPRHDPKSGEAWMYGRFEYVLYREAARMPALRRGR